MAKISRPRTEKGFAVACARVAQDKKAEDILILTLTELETAPADYFVICTCLSDTQVRAVSEALIDAMRELGIDKPRVEGLDSSQWVILDFFDTVVHVMKPDSRAFYKLEKLWGNTPAHSLNEDGKPVVYRASKSKDGDLSRELEPMMALEGE